ncbi:hypothetical protein QTP86_001083 [Hemibagrus guttatus]|nr:hypothetical protein QTP86_001083 [Hemibagrus guttatus]
MGRHVSASLTLSTGAPLGCVLSPLLYSLYTYDCMATTNSTTIIKFADDTVVVRLISDNNDTAYLEEIRNLENWCQRNNLLLRLIVDFSTKQERNSQNPVINTYVCLRVAIIAIPIVSAIMWHRVPSKGNYTLNRTEKDKMVFCDAISPECPGSSPGSLPSGACPEHFPRETPRRHPKQMPEPPQLSPFDVEEQRLYSKLLPGNRAPYPIFKGAPRHPSEEAHFGRLYPGSYPFGHDPEFMTIDQYIDRITAAAAPIHLSISQSILPSLVNKTPTRLENHGLRFGGADPHPSRFKLSCKTPQCMLTATAAENLREMKQGKKEHLESRPRQVKVDVSAFPDFLTPAGPIIDGGYV